MVDTGGVSPRDERGLPTAPADPLVLTSNLSGFSLGAHRVIDFAATVTAADGAEPFVWNASTERVRDAGQDPVRGLAALLPEESRVTRTTERRYGVRILASAAGFHVFLEESPALLEVTVTAVTPELARSVGSGILDRVVAPPSVSNQVSFRIWHRARNGVQWTRKSVNVPAWGDVERNYATASRSELEQLMRLEARDEDSTSGRLIIWHGPPGTGKTTAIRSLARSWSSWCAPELLMDPEVAFGDPSYLSEVIAHSDEANDEDRATPRWRLLIAEDADRYVLSEGGSRDRSGLDRLLNVADGILGQGTRLLILLTTSHELRALHPALIRPGRCLAVTDFHRFSAAEARQWLAGSGVSPVGGETLAQLFALRGDLDRIGSTTNTPRTPAGQYL